MSIRVQSYVWENSKADGSALLLLLAIADHAHDDGNGAYPSVATLAAKCRQTERNTQLLLRKLEDMGEIITPPQAGPHGCNIYQIPLGGENFSGVKTSAEGVKTSAKNAHQISPEPSLEPSKEQSPAATVQTGNEPIAENPFKVWESVGLAISPYHAEQLQELEKEYSPGWVCEAIRRAASQNKRNLNYITGILKRWKDSGGMDYPTKKEEFVRPSEPAVNTAPKWVST